MKTIMLAPVLRSSAAELVRAANWPNKIILLKYPICLFCLALLTATGAGQSVIVQSRFGGQIFGFDIDPNGNEGVLSESMSLPNGNYLAAVETFNQTTGQIIKVVITTKTQDDFVT